MPRVGSKHFAYSKKGKAKAKAHAKKTSQCMTHENSNYAQRLVGLLVERNWIQGAVNPDHEGFCTPITKSTCTPRRKAFAMTMKKHKGFHKK